MSRSSIHSSGTRIKAAHHYEVFDEASRKESLAGKHFHLIGIGGVGMSALARVLAWQGARVSGSDQTNSATIDGLRAQDMTVHRGHAPAHLAPDVEAVVFSAAVSHDNPELVLAQQRGCRIYKYAALLGELMNRYQGVAVCGTHGKSTTSAWLSHLVRQAGIDVNFIVGANLHQWGCSSGVGTSEYFVAETCEYDRSFLNVRPAIACLLNIEADHLDYYRDEADILSAFVEFAAGIRQEGTLIANGQDANVRQVLQRCRPDIHCMTFGLDRSCDLHAGPIEVIDGLARFDIIDGDKTLGRTHIALPGRHNVLNALAVFAAARAMGIAPDVILRLLPAFTGIDRRLMCKGTVNGITVLDDYAHHPTEIRASLEAVRQRYDARRIWCVFQPHQYSRTRFLLDEFAESFKLADVTIVPDIYFVRDSEASRQAINAQVFVDRVKANGSKALFINDFSDICCYLAMHVQSGDLVITMGAGDIWKVADEYIQRIGRRG